MPAPPTGLKSVAIAEPRNATGEHLEVNARPPDSGVAPLLRTDIRRWQPQSATWEQVTVDFGASLVEPGTGRVLWSVEQNGWIVPTEGAHNTIDASTGASRKIAETLTEGWTVAPPPERPIAP